MKTADRPRRLSVSLARADAVILTVECEFLEHGPTQVGGDTHDPTESFSPAVCRGPRRRHGVPLVRRGVVAGAAPHRAARRPRRAEPDHHGRRGLRPRRHPVQRGGRDVHAGHDLAPRPGPRDDRAARHQHRQRRHAGDGAAHRALAGGRDRDDAGLAARARPGRHRHRRAPRRGLPADAGHADGRRDGQPRRGRGRRVRPALPRSDDQAPPRRHHHGREPAAPARRGAGLGALRVHLGHHRRPDGRDQPHGRDARRADPRPAGAARGRLQRRRAGAVEHGPGRDAAQARGLLRPEQPRGAAHAGAVGPRARGGGSRRGR